MDILELRTYCLSFPESEETTPFDETTLVYKVAGKMFAMTDMIHADHVALKCDPSLALDLREEYPDIDAAYHMNKRHWNSVRLDGDLPAAFIRKMVRDSYLLVIGGMSASMVSINPVIAIGSGDSAIKLIDVINGIMPKMLSLFTTLGIYRLLKKGTKPNTILLGIIVVSVLLTAIGIF